MSTMVRKALSSRILTLRKLTERASNDPQRMRARKIEAEIMEKMPSRAWLSCTAVSRLISASDDRKTRARLDRLVRDGKIERKREQGSHGPVYLFRRLREQRPAGRP
jgi:ribosomal protein L19E